MYPKVSIIIPIYNCKDYLEHCLNSVINQTLKEIEIILVNDGSNDGSNLIIDKFAAVDSRIKVINQENKGAAAARNSGIKISKGEYIGFVDSDDYIEKNMYEILYKNSKNYIDIIQCNYFEVKKSDETIKYVNHEFKKNEILDRYDIEKYIIPSFASSKNNGFYCLWNKIYRRKFIVENKLLIDENLDIAEDWWFNIICFTKVKNIRFIKERLYYYIHQNENSLMNVYRKNQLELQLICRKKICDLLKSYKIDQYKNEFNIRFINGLTSNILIEFKNNNNFNYKRFKHIMKNKVISDAVINYREINNITKFCWYLIYIRRYYLSYILFKIIYIIFNVKTKILN